jgi:hypothetical protein
MRRPPPLTHNGHVGFDIPTPVMRVSLAFKAFIKGELGSEERLNRLVV